MKIQEGYFWFGNQKSAIRPSFLQPPRLIGGTTDVRIGAQNDGLTRIKRPLDLYLWSSAGIDFGDMPKVGIEPTLHEGTRF